MGFVQKDSLRTMLISYFGIGLGFINKGLLFLLILSTEQIGLINLLIAVGILFAQLSNFGSVYTIWRFFPFFHNEERNNHGFFSFVLSILGLGILVFSLIYLFFKPQIVQFYAENSRLFIDYYFWVIPIGISYSLYLSLEMYLRSFKKNIFSILVFDLGLRLMVFASLILFWQDLISFQNFVVLNSLFYIIPTTCLILYLSHLNLLRFDTIKGISKRFKGIMYKYSIWNYFNSLGAILVNSLDVLMIAHYIGIKATGVYTTIVFLASAIQVPYKAIIRVSSPLVAEYWKSKDMIAMEDIYKKVSSVSLVIGLGSFMILWLNIDYLFSFLKSEFQDGIWVFFFLMMGRLLDMFFGLNGSIFATSKKYKYDLAFTIILILSVFALNLYLIPIYGIIGAAISTGCALVFYNLGRLLFVYFVFKLNPFSLRQLPIILIALGVLFLGNAFSDLFDNGILQLAFQCALVIGLFFGPILIFNLEPESYAYLKNGLSNLKRKLKA